MHPGVERRLSAERRVFEHQAARWRHAQAARGFQVGVGGGLAVGDVLGRHQRLEMPDQAEGLQDRRHDRLEAAGCHRQRVLALQRQHEIDDRRNGLHAGDQRHEDRFLLLGELHGGQAQAVAFVEEIDHRGRRHAADGVKDLLREVAPARVEHGAPGAVVERHRVGEGAVAIEEIGRKFAGRDVQSDHEPGT